MKKQTKINGFINRLAYVVGVGISIFFLFFFIGCSWIGYEVKSQCQDAKREYGGDCVEALTKQLEDEGKGFKARNDAIWVLGQLGDRRALPALNDLYTGIIPARESLYKTISQYELKKAIKLAHGGANITAFIWRGMLNEK